MNSGFNVEEAIISDKRNGSELGKRFHKVKKSEILGGGGGGGTRAKGGDGAQLEVQLI